MKRNVCIAGLVLTVIGTGCVMSNFSVLNGGQNKQLLRGGVYDSRGIAIAYAHSHFNDEWYQKMKAQLDAAEAAGDEQKVKELKEAGEGKQAKAHLQGFGTAPVHEYLLLVKNKLPQVAEAAGVDVIVSKWEFDYIASDAETVDLTMELATLFEPKEKAYAWIKQFKDKDPISHEELERLEKEHTH